MKTCAKCGHGNDDGARFCDQCAAPLAAAPGPTPAAGATAAPVVAAVARRKKLLRLVLAFVAIDVAVVIFFLSSGVFSSSVEGEIRSTGMPNGDFVMAPPACHSGEHESFFGVWIAPELEEIDGRTGFRGGLKVLKNPLGQWEAYLESPNTCRGFECQVLQVKREHCLVFDILVENSGTVVNDVRLREGYAKLQCRFPEGGTLMVDLKFSGCD
jgi:hypothetical protein